MSFALVRWLAVFQIVVRVVCVDVDVVVSCAFAEESEGSDRANTTRVEK